MTSMRTEATPPENEIDYSPEIIAELQQEQAFSDSAEEKLAEILLNLLLREDHAAIVAAGFPPRELKVKINNTFKPFAVSMIYETTLRKSPGRKHLLDEDVQRQANTLVNSVTKQSMYALDGVKAAEILNLPRKTLEDGEIFKRKSEAWANEAAATIVTFSVERVKEQLSRSLGLTHKKWLTRLDNKVRHSHRVLEGQTIKIEDVFTMPSGAKLSRPGDPTAPLSERLNCRCRLLYLLPGKSE